MTAEKHNNIGRITALISFLIGTTFFAMHFFNHNVCIMIEGLLYIILAFFINIFILLIIYTNFNSFIKNKNSFNRIKLKWCN